MSQNVEEVLESALALPVEDRARIIDELVISCADEHGAALDEAWTAEIQRRSAEFDAGLVEASTWDEVKARLKRKV